MNASATRAPVSPRFGSLDGSRPIARKNAAIARAASFRLGVMRWLSVEETLADGLPYRLAPREPFVERVIVGHLHLVVLPAKPDQAPFDAAVEIEQPHARILEHRAHALHVLPALLV